MADPAHPASPASREDLYRLAALLGELDRMMHPAGRTSYGTYRLPVWAAPPLPPTGVPGAGDRAGSPGGRTSAAWTPTPPPARPAAPPAVPWVEPSPHPATRRAPAPPGAEPARPVAPVDQGLGTPGVVVPGPLPAATTPAALPAAWPVGEPVPVLSPGPSAASDQGTAEPARSSRHTDLAPVVADLRVPVVPSQDPAPVASPPPAPPTPSPPPARPGRGGAPVETPAQPADVPRDAPVRSASPRVRAATEPARPSGASSPPRRPSEPGETERVVAPAVVTASREVPAAVPEIRDEVGPGAEREVLDAPVAPVTPDDAPDEEPGSSVAVPVRPRGPRRGPVPRLTPVEAGRAQARLERQFLDRALRRSP
jgi:hypothetical protein